MASTKSGDAGSKPSNPFGIPDFDLQEALSRLHLPGVDLEKVLDEQRKNVDAIREANRSVLSGWEALARKQAQVFQDSIEQWQQAMQDALAGKQPTPEQRAEMMRQGFEQALDNMRALAEIAAQHQNEAYEIVRKRMEANIQSFFGDRDRQNE